MKKDHLDVDIFDPAANAEEVEAEYGYRLVAEIEPETYDGILVAVKHKEFSDMGSAKIRDFGKPDHILFDLKKMFELSEVDLCL